MTVLNTLYLLPRYRKMVCAILRQHVPDADVWAYGSRVRGDCHDTSDLDLVIRHPTALETPCPVLADVIEAFSRSNLPIMVQIIDWARIPPAFHREILAGYVVVQWGEAIKFFE
ncbi:nucleotidyltransferase domain-containing protein [Rhodoferax sp. 4810]|uniref:Nucleotidyltransferase domain-containing protein n=1 Tax=Thiospirillum jenense TaxID=1653858 RepID=A0A839H2R0_9GAMM|nr:nucleotidyltransferase domain-containing protein [Thiospirillum jenense]MBB1076539.1 nucleotidyltransferase domain-containing protein [Rhodoferax jenense]MBB1124755.1 nucleotidyltransferase domain-containing protein [Thiospirillum jenense]